MSILKIFLALALSFPGFLPAVEVPLDVKQSSLKFTGHAFMHDFQGEAKEFSGSAEVNSQNAAVVLSANISIQAARMTTFESTRDRNMLDWLHVETNPDIRFHLTQVKQVKGDPATASRDHPAQFLVQGTFELNKITKPLATQAVGWREGGWLVVAGTTQVDTAEHGLPIIKQLFMTVDKKVDITFRLVFDLPPDLRLPARP